MLTLQGKNEEVAGHQTDDLVSFNYNNRGNLRKIQTTDGTIGQYYYDDRNKLVYSSNKMGILSQYTYDGMGRRIKQTLDASNINVSETSKLYDQDLLEELMTDDNGIVIKDKKSINYVYDVTSEENDVLLVYGKHTETNRYIYGIGLISIDSWHEEEESWSKVSEDNFDVTLYYVKDVLGSVRALVDDSNKINKVYDYDVFGTPLEKNHVNDQGIRTNIYHYAGYIFDYATSQYFVNARYYQPETARFTAKDLLLVDGFNRYKYVSNNPLMYVDPLGLNGEGVWTDDSFFESTYITTYLKDGYSVYESLWWQDLDKILSLLDQFDQDISLNGPIYVPKLSTGLNDIVGQRKLMTIQKALWTARVTGAWDGDTRSSIESILSVSRSDASPFYLDSDLLNLLKNRVNENIQYSKDHPDQFRFYNGLEATNFDYDFYSLVGYTTGILSELNNFSSQNTENQIVERKIADNTEVINVERASEDRVLFGQKSVSQNFSQNGKFNGASILEVVEQLQNGTLSADDLPIEYIMRDGQMITLNNRSLTGLSRAGLKPTVLIDKTGNAFLENQLTSRLAEMGGSPSESILIRTIKEIVEILD